MFVVSRASMRLLLLLGTLSLSACGGGGGGGADDSNDSGGGDNGGSTATTDLSGWATKGPLNGVINVYSIDADGQRGALVSGPVSVVDGRFELTLPAGQSFPLEVVLTTGQYVDENTGANIVFEAERDIFRENSWIRQ